MQLLPVRQCTISTHLEPLVGAQCHAAVVQQDTCLPLGSRAHLQLKQSLTAELLRAKPAACALGDTSDKGDRGMLMQSSMAASTSGRCSTGHASTVHWQHARLVSRPRSIGCRASDTNAFAQRAQEIAETAQQRVQDFVKQQKLDEKAAAASQSAKEQLTAAYEETEQSVRRTFMKLESEHNISGRIEEAKKKATEAARDLDQEYSVSRKIKATFADAKRMWPTWKRQFSNFSQTQVGKTTLLVTFVALLFSGALWQVLNVVWLLWWLSIPVSLLVANKNRRAAQQAAATGSDPFTGGRWGSTNYSSGFGSSGFGSSSSNSNSTRGNNADGPVVDAEWISLDEDDSSNSSRRRR